MLDLYVLGVDPIRIDVFNVIQGMEVCLGFALWGLEEGAGLRHGKERSRENRASRRRSDQKRRRSSKEE